MFVHNVYFWLRPDLTPEQLETYKNGLASLISIESVHSGYFGVPASTDRPIIDRTYSYALVVVFADQGAHDAYQVHPVHDRFREQCSTFWSDIKIYDCITDGWTRRANG